MRSVITDIAPETIHSLRKGDQEAFRKIYLSLTRQLYLFAKDYIVRDDEAEDAAAEAFVALWSRRKDFDNVPAVIAFLRKTIKNRCLDYLKHQAVKDRHEQPLIQILEADDASDFSNEMIRLEVLRAIYEQAEQLPERIRQVFMLSFKDGLTPAEIAAQLNISIQTVRNQKMTAVQLLRKAFINNPLVLAMLLTV